MTLRRAAFVVALTIGACTSDDDDAASTSAPAPVTTPPAASSAPPTASRPTAATTAPPMTTVAGSTTSPNTSPTVDLAAALLDREELELPVEWVTRDLDPATELDADLEADFDPFLGLVECAPGVLREGPDVEWAERSLVSPTDPQDDGLLSVRMTIERESDAEHAADVEQLAGCAASNPQVLVEVEGGRLRVTAAPTAEVAFPSAFNYTVAHEQGLTVSVLMYGLDLGHDWGPRSDQVAGRILDRAD